MRGWLALWLALAAGASAAERRVVLLRGSSGVASVLEVVEKRLRVELERTGVEVMVRDLPCAEGEDAIEQLNGVIAADGALAALCLVRRSSGAIRIWLSEASTGKVMMHEYSGALRSDPARLSMSIVEFIHASLLDLQLAPADEVPVRTTSTVESAPVVIDTPVASQVETPWPRRSLEAGVGGLASFESLPVQFAVALGYRIPFLPRWGVRAEVLGTPSAVSLSAAEGRASVWQANARLWLSWQPLDGPVVRPDFELGAGAAVLVTAGEPALGYKGATSVAWTADVALRPGLQVRLSEELWVRGFAAVSVGVPPLEVVFAGRRVARAGLPTLGLGVGLAWQ